MNHKNNRRSAATKKRIRDSLLILLKDHPLNRITVRALCEHAEINRSTFYNHYNSPDEILTEIKASFLHSITSCLNDWKEVCDMNDKETVIEHFMTAILEFIVENKEICLLLKNSDITPSIGSLVMEDPMIQECFYDALSGNYPAENMDYIYHYIQYGGFSAIDLWLTRGCDLTPQELAKLLASLISRF